MKTEEHLEPRAVFIHRVTAAVSELKDELQQDYERTYPDLGEIIRIVLNQEEAKAWELSFFPHLFLPDMVEAQIATLGLKPPDAKRDNIVPPSVFGVPTLVGACAINPHTSKSGGAKEEL
jgi:hypothetical protein